MIQAFCRDADASTVGATQRRLGALPVPAPESPESVRHIICGSIGAVQAIVHHLYKLNYAEPNDWSKPMPTGRANEVMVILTKRVRLSGVAD